MGSTALRRLTCALLSLPVLIAMLACTEPLNVDTILGGGETLRVRGSRPTTLDPALVADGVSWTYAIQIHAGLVRLDDDLQVVPDLAERWDISADGRTYRFRLRPARFHSGREVVAEDLKYAMERTLRPETGSTGALLYLGDIVGAADLRSGKATSLRGVRVIDSRTLEIEIDERKSYFLAKLTFPTAFALDRANVESRSDWAAAPNGAGPFRLVAWEPESKITLRRFQQYWAGPARVLDVEFDLSPIPGIVLYERGEVDLTEVDLSSIDRVSDPASPISRQLVTSSMLSTWYVGFNATRPPFDDPQIRRAFAHATDRDRFVDVYMRGTRVQATTILPPGLRVPRPGVAAPHFDIQEARNLVAASRYARAMPEIVISVSEGSADTGEALAEMYSRNLGLDIGVREVAGYFAALERHEPQMFFTGWIADYPDPENFLDLLFHTGSSANYMGYSNPTLDAILRDARTASDHAARDTLYARAEQLILSDAAAVPIHHEVTRVLVKPHVSGIRVTPLGIVSFRGAEVGKRPVRRAA